MLIAQDLADLLKTEMQGASTAEEATAKFGQVLSQYIVDNSEITFAWNGIQAPAVVDPVVVAQGKVTALSITITPSLFTDPTTANSNLAQQITLGVRTTGFYNITALGFICTPNPLTLIPDLILTPSGLSEPSQAILSLCQTVITWLNSYIPITPILGSHGSFTAPPGTGGIATTGIL